MFADWQLLGAHTITIQPLCFASWPLHHGLHRGTAPSQRPWAVEDASIVKLHDEIVNVDEPLALDAVRCVVLAHRPCLSNLYQPMPDTVACFMLYTQRCFNQSWTP